MKPRYRFDKHVLSHVVGPEDSGVLIAASPRYEHSNNRDFVFWWDPIGERAFDLKTVSENDVNSLKWKDRDGREFHLVPMTLDVYNKKVRREIDGARSFLTQAAMEDWFTKGVWEEMYGT